MAQKKILMVSLGSIGKRHLRNTRTLLPDAQIAVYRQHTSTSEVPEGADILLTSLEDAIAFAPDAVLVSSPASEHIACAQPFVEKDIPLFLEKPLAESSEHIAGFLKAAKASKGFAMVGYVLRFLPALHALRALIAEGKIGALRSAHIQVGQYLPDWRPDSDYRQGVSAQKKLGGGALLELSHELDYTSWLFGLPDSVQCLSGNVSDLEMDVEDVAHLLLGYGGAEPKQVIVQLDFLQRVAHMGVQVIGAEATLQADLIKEKIWLYSPEKPDGELLDTPRSASGNEVYMRQFDFFFAQAFDDYTPQFEESKHFEHYASIDAAADVLRLVDEAKRANTSGMRLPFKGAV